MLQLWLWRWLWLSHIFHRPIVVSSCTQSLNQRQCHTHLCEWVLPSSVLVSTVAGTGWNEMQSLCCAAADMLALPTCCQCSLVPSLFPGQGDFPWDKKHFQYMAFAAAGMLSAFVYLHLRETGREISWRDFVNHYLTRRLVRTCSLF